MKSLSRFRTPFCAVVLTTLASTSWLASPARAAAGRWELIGPYGGWFTALTVAQSERRTVYAGTVGGRVFLSTNAGVTWTDVSGDFPGAPAVDLEVDPRDPSTVYAAICSPAHREKPAEGGIYKTVDGGGTWDLLEGLGVCQVNDIAVDRRNPDQLFAATNAGLYLSGDGGASWRRHPGRPGRGEVRAVTVDPSIPGVVYAIHAQSGFLKSVNGGAGWTPRNSGLAAVRQQLSGFAFTTRGPKVLYLYATGAEIPVFRSRDGGERWSPHVAGLDARPVYDMAVNPISGAVYAATDDGVFRLDSAGRNWLAPIPGMVFASVRVLAVPPAPASVVYAGTRQSVFKSVDAGGTWSSSSRGFNTLMIDDVAVAPSDGSVLYARTDIDGFQSTADGGTTWMASGPGIGGLPLTLAVHPQAPHTAFAAGYGGIWKTTDRGVAWRRVTPDTCLTVTGLAFDPQVPSTVYAAGYASNCPVALQSCTGLKSTDGGESWSCLGIAAEGVGTLALARSLPTTLYAGIGSWVASPVLKSTDAGQHWLPSSGGLPLGPVHGLAVSPQDARTVYALASAGLYKSVDGGGTWVPAQNGLPAGVTLASLTIAPSDPSRLYVAVFGYTASGAVVFHSKDAGASWSLLPGEGLPIVGIRSLQVSPTDPRTVFAATSKGVYKVTVTAQ